MSLFNFKIMKKLILSFYIVLLSLFTATAQQKTDHIKTALLIVDIQNFYFPGDGPGLVNVIPASLNAREILQLFREKKQLVVHVKHKAVKGGEIHKNVEPIAGEKVITKVEVNSFLNTDLLEYLKKNEVTRLVIIGMQTHLCLEAATRAGHDFGFECVVVGDACATKDVKYGDHTVKAEDVHYSTLATINSNYGKVIDLKTFKENPDKYLFQKLN
jgi:nicotinamidase-related amidase